MVLVVWFGTAYRAWMCVLTNQAHNTHSSVGSSVLFVSSLAALSVCSEGMTISSFFEAVTEGCGTWVILELRICQQHISSWLESIKTTVIVPCMCVRVCMRMCVHVRVCGLLPWVQPSVGSHFQIRLHPEASTGPGPAGVERTDLSQGEREIPLAGPMHLTTTAIKINNQCQSELEMFLTMAAGFRYSCEMHSSITFMMSISSLGSRTWK